MSGAESMRRTCPARHIAFEVVDRVFLVVYTGDPTDEEWRDYIQEVKRHGVDRTMQLIVTDGGGPSLRQRYLCLDLLAGPPVPVAVISGSVAVRVLVMVMSCFNRRLKVFPPSDLCGALDHLEIPGSRVELIERHIAALRQQLVDVPEGRT